MRIASVVALFVALMGVARAEAPTAKAIAEGKEHYRQGTQLYDVGKYTEAAAEYETAFRLTELPALLFNMGQAYRLAGDAKKALAAYQGFIRRVPGAPQRAEVEGNIATLQKQIQEDDARKAAEDKITTDKAAADAAAQRAAAEKAAQSSTGSNALVAQEQPKRKVKPWVWAAVGVGAVVVVGVALGVGLGVGLSKTDYPGVNSSFSTGIH
jgi:tetratricopeptide (TPR) repeat protein